MLMLVNAMQHQLRHAARNLKGEEGEVTIEWGVLVVFIALALIAVVGVIVTGINGWFGNISTFIGGTAPTGPVQPTMP